MSAAYRFDATCFVQRGYEAADGDWPERTKRDISALRASYPELAHWGNLALGLAFGDYSQDVYEVNWAEWSVERRDDLFLCYCCWRQTRGAWRRGLDEKTLAQASEWRPVAG